MFEKYSDGVDLAYQLDEGLRRVHLEVLVNRAGGFHGQLAQLCDHRLYIPLCVSVTWHTREFFSMRELR